MYIEPNSTIHVLNDVPLDIKQSDTLWFASVTDQTQYFYNHRIATFSQATYQRVNRGYCRVQMNAERLYYANYMMFQNYAYGSKWFYAFVTSVEYINDNTTQLNFTIDPIQTWFFNYETHDCFIERVTTRTDGLCEHYEPEPVQIGEQVYNSEFNAIGSAFNEKSIVVMYIDALNDNIGSMYGGTYGACELKCYRLSEYADLKEFINSKAQAPDSIVGIYMCPTVLINDIHGGNTIPTTWNGYKTLVNNIPAITANDTLDGYKPRNKKMYTYPYNYYSANTPNGQSLQLRYEFFKNFKPTFSLSGNFTAPVAITLMPTAYKGSDTEGSGGYAAENRTERLTITGFPVCSYSTDSFKAWWAQNAVPIVAGAAVSFALPVLGLITGTAAIGALSEAGMIGEAASSITPAKTRDALGRGGASAIGGIVNALMQGYQASIAADITKGSFDSGNADFAYGRMYFQGARVSLNALDAERIDNFFTMFGYAIGKYGSPSRHNRSRFTYIKTQDCNVGGALPADDAKYIAACYDNGIRFWADHNDTTIGTYFLTNEPLG